MKKNVATLVARKRKMGCHKLHIKQNKALVKGALGLYISYKKGCAGAYRYGFNGQEKDNEIKGVGNSLDFGARIYDSRLGRWLSLDPLQAKYPSMSAYCFVGNMPIVAIDPDGKKIVIERLPPGADGKPIIRITISAKIINESSKAYTTEQMDLIKQEIVKSVQEIYSGGDENINWESNITLTTVSADNPLEKDDHAVYITDQGFTPNGNSFEDIGGFGSNLGFADYNCQFVYLSTKLIDNFLSGKDLKMGDDGLSNEMATLYRTVAHEFLHSMGEKHPDPEGSDNGNLRNPSYNQNKKPCGGKEIIGSQILKIEKKFKDNTLNNGEQKAKYNLPTFQKNKINEKK